MNDSANAQNSRFQVPAHRLGLDVGLDDRGEDVRDRVERRGREHDRQQREYQDHQLGQRQRLKHREDRARGIVGVEHADDIQLAGQLQPQSVVAQHHEEQEATHAAE